MTGFGVLLRKELTELARTRRAIVLPLVLLFFAISGPIVAKVINQFLGSSLPAGVTLPDPTYVDAWGQWAKNLGQLGVLVLIATLGSAVSGEVRQGTALLVLTKPVSRAAFVLAKFLANWLLLVTASVIAMLITGVLTATLFPGADWTPLWRSTGVWLVLATMMAALTIALSAALPTTGAAIGAAIGVFIALSIVGVWGAAAKWSPAGLGAAMTTLAAGGEAPIWWPSITGLALGALALWGAIARFQRREL